MLVFLLDYAWILAVLILLSLMGGFLVAPFYKTLKYPLFLSPLSGLFILALGTSVFYNGIGLNLKISLLTTIFFSTLFTFFIFISFYSKIKKVDLLMLIIVLMIIGFITLNYTTLLFQKKGTLFTNEINLGYAHLSDWLNTFLTKAAPQKNVSLEVWSNFISKEDSHLGTIILLSSLFILSGKTAAYTYYIACSLILCAAISGIAAVFARTRFTFVLLTIGLIFSSWYGLSTEGHIGQTLAYSAILIIIGLFFNMERPVSAILVTPLIILTCAASCIYPGIIIALLLTVTGTLYIIIQSFYLKSSSTKKRFLAYRDDIVTIFLLIGISIVTIGSLAKPILENNFNFPYLLQKIFVHGYVEILYPLFLCVSLQLINKFFSPNHDTK